MRQCYTPVVEVEESLCRIHTQASSYIFIVGQCGTEAQQTHVLLSQLHVTDGSCHQRFQHRSTVVMKQVDFILNDVYLVIMKVTSNEFRHLL